MIDVESLGRKAIDIIKSKWNLPQNGTIAGGSISNIIWELVSGNKAIVNDIDVFIFDKMIKENEQHRQDGSLFRYKDIDISFYEDYSGLNLSTNTKDFYSITEVETNGIFNIIKYKSNTDDPGVIIKSFDINCTRIAYSIDLDKLFWDKEFEDFLINKKLKISNIMTPSHTAIRIAKKGQELNIPVDTFEYNLIQGILNRSYPDIIKKRFKQRYADLFEKYSYLIKDYFLLERDLITEEMLKESFNVEDKIYNLKSTTDVDDFNFRAYTSMEFLNYMRHMSNSIYKEYWDDLHFFIYDESYFDKDVPKEDIDLLKRFIMNSPDSIKNLKWMKLSEQVNLIKYLLDYFKDDPIIAISILGKNRLDPYIKLDDQTALLLELSVRKSIVNDTYNKVGKILNPDETNVNLNDINI